MYNANKAGNAKNAENSVNAGKNKNGYCEHRSIHRQSKHGGGTTASRNLASEDRFRAALEGFAGPDAKVVVEDYPRETHGTIAVPVFHEAMKRLLIGGAAAGR